MKKFYLVALATYAGFLANSQPILTQANTAPVLGDSYTMSRFNWTGVVPSTGANQTWDYSGVTVVTTADMDFVDPSTCPSAGSFSASTIACNIDAGTQYEFNQISSTQFLRNGFYAGGYTIPYSDAEKLLEFPFAYNDTYVDNFASTFTTSVTMTRVGDVTVTAVGYGDVILPNSTVENVLLVKVSEDYGDSYMGTELYHYNTDIYMFYKPGVHMPVLALTHYVQGSTTVNYGNFLDDASLGTAEETAETISIYPVPATDVLNITMTEPMQVIEIYNVLGERVYQNNGVIKTVDLTAFENGVYFIHFWDGENRTIRKFIKN